MDARRIFSIVKCFYIIKKKKIYRKPAQRQYRQYVSVGRDWQIVTVHFMPSNGRYPDLSAGILETTEKIPFADIMIPEGSVPVAK